MFLALLLSPEFEIELVQLSWLSSHAIFFEEIAIFDELVHEVWQKMKFS